MIGDKRLEMPKTIQEAIKINESFGFKDYENFPKLYTAERLVKLNNEVYEKMQKLEEEKEMTNDYIISLQLRIESLCGYE